MKDLRITFILILLIIFSVTLTGCYDMKELDERAFVLAYGVDNSKISKIKFTVMIASPKRLYGGGQQGGGDEEKGLVVTTVDSISLPIAINVINSYIGRTLYFGHADYGFYGEDFVKNGNETTLIAPMQFRELRKDSKLFIVKGDVAKFINSIKPKIAASPIKYLRRITESQKTTGFIPTSEIFKLFEGIESLKIDPIMPLCALPYKKQTDKKESSLMDYQAGTIPKEGGLPVEFMGSAVFKGKKMVSTLNGMETRLVNLIRGDFERGYFIFPDLKNPNYYESVRIIRGKTPTVKVDLSGHRPQINVVISLDGDLVVTQGYTDYSNLKNLSALEEKIENILSADSNKLVKRMQKYNTDVFGFGYHVAKKFWTWDDYIKYNWLKKKFKVADIDIKYSYQIRRLGFQAGPIKPGD